MIQFKPGNLITLQPSHPIGEGLNLIVLGTEYTEVKWVKRNTIGLYIKTMDNVSLDPFLLTNKGNKKAICLFGEELFEVAWSCIQPYTEE